MEMFAKLGFESLIARLSQLEAKEEKRRDEETAAKIEAAAINGTGGTGAGFVLGIYTACAAGLAAYAIYDAKRSKAQRAEEATSPKTEPITKPAPSQEAHSSMLVEALSTITKNIEILADRLDSMERHTQDQELELARLKTQKDNRSGKAYSED